MKRVVYTCLFGHSELFNDFHYPVAPADNIDFVCFTDDLELRSDVWRIERVDRGDLDPARASKKIKALPHVYLPDYDCSLYVDNVVRLKAPPAHIFDEYLARAASPLVCFRHHERDCVYDEARIVVQLSYDRPARVRMQMEWYRRLGYPRHKGLSKSTFMLRRHDDARLRRVMETWHAHVLAHSHRDQLSFRPACWMEGFTPEHLPLAFDAYNLFAWPVMKDGRRLPRDFDDAVYLALNPDVAALAIDPRKHFLTTGQAERRRYRRLDLADALVAPGAVLRRIKARAIERGWLS